MCLGLQSCCFVKTFSLLSPCWGWARSCEPLGACLRLCAANWDRGLMAGTGHLNWPCQSGMFIGHLVGQSINSTIFLMRLVPQYVKHGTFQQPIFSFCGSWCSSMGILPPKKDCVCLFPAYYTDAGSSWEQKQTTPFSWFLLQLGLFHLHHPLRHSISVKEVLVSQDRSGQGCHYMGTAVSTTALPTHHVALDVLCATSICEWLGAVKWVVSICRPFLTAHQAFLTPRVFHGELNMIKAFTTSLSLFAHSSAWRTLFLTYKCTFQKSLSRAELWSGEVYPCKDMILWIFLCRDNRNSS